MQLDQTTNRSLCVYTTSTSVVKPCFKFDKAPQTIPVMVNMSITVSVSIDCQI